MGSLYHAVVGVHDQSEDTIVLVKAKSESDADMQVAIEALLDAESVTSYKPKVIIATRLSIGKKDEAQTNPGTATESKESNPVEGNQPQTNRSRSAISKAIEVTNK